MGTRKIKTCSKCGATYKSKLCPDCRAEQRWQTVHAPRLIKTAFTPRVAADLARLLPVELHDDDVNALRISHSVYVWGDEGCGKTTYAAALALEVAHHNYIDAQYTGPVQQPIFITLTDLLDAARSAYSDYDIDGATSVLDLYKQAQLLIIDDIGAGQFTGRAAAMVTSIINYRYEYNRGTIFSSNLDMNELHSHYGDRFASRVYGMCDELRLVGEKDRRIGKKKEGLGAVHNNLKRFGNRP